MSSNGEPRPAFACPKCGEPDFPAERNWFTANGYGIFQRARAGDAAALELEILGDKLAALQKERGTLCGSSEANESKARMAELVRPMMGVARALADVLVAEYLEAKRQILARAKRPEVLTPREEAGMFLKVGGTAGALEMLRTSPDPAPAQYEARGVAALVVEALGPRPTHEVN